MEKPKNTNSQSRRKFLKQVAIGGGLTIALGNLSFTFIEDEQNPLLKKKVIICDYSICAGCKTCEISCSAYNFKSINGKQTYGLVNPKHTNIKVHQFNPALDIPATCAGCPDTPCVNACPVTINQETGEKALYVKEGTMAIAVHEDQCVGCGLCARACKTERVGVIRRNAETGKPEGLCTYCDGDPSCVKNCPYGALSYVTVDTGYEFFGKSPEEIAKILSNRFYGVG